MDRPRVPFGDLFAYGAVFAGAAMLMITPHLPIASLDWVLDDERHTIQPGVRGGWWLIFLCGLAAAAPAVVALVRHRPAWTAWAAAPGLVGTGTALYYAFVRLPTLDGRDDNARLEWGGSVWLAAGPVILAGALAAARRLAPAVRGAG